MYFVQSQNGLNGPNSGYVLAKNRAECCQFLMSVAATEEKKIQNRIQTHSEIGKVKKKEARISGTHRVEKQHWWHYIVMYTIALSLSLLPYLFLCRLYSYILIEIYVCKMNQYRVCIICIRCDCVSASFTLFYACFFISLCCVSNSFLSLSLSLRVYVAVVFSPFCFK